MTATKLGILGICGVLSIATMACGKKVEEEAGSTTAEVKTKDVDGVETTVKMKAGKGVDLEKKVVTIGALNDESGPGAAIGKPFADGKRLAVAVVNAGGILPEGWTVKLVEKDHGYNPQKSVQEFNAIKDSVLYIASSFGTPNTLPLRDMLERENMMAFPASLSSQMASHRSTPPLGASYVVETQRAADWAVADAGDASKVKAGIIYQKDDYGEDGLKGLKLAAAHHGFDIVSEQTISPGQKDVTAAITSLKGKGANYVFLTVLPSTTGAILGTAAATKFAPKWIGNTATWVDVFFSEKSPLPAKVLTNFHWVNGLPFWGEDLPGMDAFLKAYEAHKDELGTGRPDFYTLVSYVQGMVQFEALRRAIDNGDITRKGFMSGLQSIKKFTAGGLLNPMDMSLFPYQTNNHARVLKPDFAKKSWTVVADYALPLSLNSKGEGSKVEDKKDTPPAVAKPVEATGTE
ncbi:MAG: ABC transporter substrate-binding protein [Kofleriaceae bacterium]|nr:ABC transporter substrate-binding protein [Kofleriaceae bacterium]